METMINNRKHLLHLIHTLYDVDKSLGKSLAIMKASALTPDLKELLEGRNREKKKQMGRLEIVFALLKEDPEKIQEKGNTDPKLKSSNIELALELGTCKLPGHDLATINHSITKHLIEIYQSAIRYSAALGYTKITRILRRSLLVEKEIEHRLKAFEESGFYVAKATEVCHE